MNSCFCASPKLLHRTAHVEPNRTFLQTPEVLKRIVKEVRDGTICGKVVRAELPERARELERIFTGKRSGLLKEVWPQLSVVECWTSSTSALYVDHVRRCVGPDVDIFPTGYTCTESPIALPVNRERHAPRCDVRVLRVNSRRRNVTIRPAAVRAERGSAV
jgi:hypothetical protein